jgi:hypothetical protein
VENADLERSPTMKHFAVVAIAALMLPASALGKGPSAASIDGPGTGDGISVSLQGADAMMLGELTSRSGLYLQTFGEDAGKTLVSRPNGDLGPKYTVTWTVPGPNNEVWKLRQDVYPYATPAPFTYMEPGQKVYDRETTGGWFQALPALKQTLVAAGLPSRATGASSGGSSDFPTAAVLTAFLLFAAATALVIRRRNRTRPAAA